MPQHHVRFGAWIVALLGVVLLASTALPGAIASPLAQQPTSSLATVTSTPSGPIARVTTDQPEVRVRAGPDQSYPIIGLLLAGQQVPALGRSPGGNWVQVSYPGVPGNVGWVFSNLLILPPDAVLPIIEPPPTPTPRTTPTIDPTLAAQFIVELPPTRLPTFTPPPPLVIPTFTAQEDAGGLIPGIPAGLPIVILAVFGILGVIFSLLRAR